MSEAKKTEVKLLSGGNPQIPKGDGEGPIHDWIAAVPGFKSQKAQQVHDLIKAVIPGVTMAVRWNSPFYAAGEGWILALHGYTKFLRLTFMNGAHLDPLPSGPSKDPNTRYLDLYEDKPQDEAQLRDWITQAAKKPGWQG